MGAIAYHDDSSSTSFSSSGSPSFDDEMMDHNNNDNHGSPTTTTATAAAASVTTNPATVFPLGQLPMELQLMIVKASLEYHPASIVVGHQPALHWEHRTATAGAITRTCSAFHTPNMIKHMYDQNIFELVSEKWQDFFHHKFRYKVKHIRIQTWSIVQRWEVDMLLLVDRFTLLERLAIVELRVNGPPNALWSTMGLPIQPTVLKKFVKIVCRACRRVTQIHISIDHHRASELVPVWTNWVEAAVQSEYIWPEGRPRKREAISYKVLY